MVHHCLVDTVLGTSTMGLINTPNYGWSGFIIPILEMGKLKDEEVREMNDS